MLADKYKDFYIGRNIYSFYRKPTFWNGMASLFDLLNVRRTHDFKNNKSGFRDVARDFQMVGYDLNNAMATYEKRNIALRNDLSNPQGPTQKNSIKKEEVSH